MIFFFVFSVTQLSKTAFSVNSDNGSPSCLIKECVVASERIVSPCTFRVWFSYRVQCVTGDGGAGEEGGGRGGRAPSYGAASARHGAPAPRLGRRRPVGLRPLPLSSAATAHKRHCDRCQQSAPKILCIPSAGVNPTRPSNLVLEVSGYFGIRAGHADRREAAALFLH